MWWPYPHGSRVIFFFFFLQCFENIVQQSSPAFSDDLEPARSSTFLYWIKYQLPKMEWYNQVYCHFL